MKLNRCFLLVAVALAGCSSEIEEARRSAELAISKQLKDPDSAKYLDTFTVWAPADGSKFRDLAVCGVVNAKNSFGGYTGGTRYVVKQMLSTTGPKTQDTIFAVIEGTERDAIHQDRKKGKAPTVFEEVYWNQYCVDPTHPPTFSGKFQ